MVTKALEALNAFKAGKLDSGSAAFIAYKDIFSGVDEEGAAANIAEVRDAGYMVTFQRREGSGWDIFVKSREMGTLLLAARANDRLVALCNEEHEGEVK
jgi:hypothetical protein